MTIVDVCVLALYPPIVFFSGWALWLYGARVLYPAIRKHAFHFSEHALVIAFCCSMVADFTENLYYGASRSSRDVYVSLSMFLPTVGVMKVFILMAATFAVAGYRRAVTGRFEIGYLVGIAMAIWAVSAMLIGVTR